MRALENGPVAKAHERIDVEAVLGSAGEDRASWWQQPHAGWLGMIGLVVVGVLAAWVLRGSDTATSYVTEPVTIGGLTVFVTATGSVQPTERVEVSSELSGIVRKVLVDYNSPVKSGDVLAELDTDKLAATVEASRAKVAAAEARVREAEATVREKERDFVRKRDLAAKEIASAQDLDVAQAARDRAVAALNSARAEAKAAQADLKLAETNLAKACICSPIDGVVLARNVDPGQTVASSFQAPVLFAIAKDLRQMELQVDVDEADVGKVEIGQFATFTVDSYPDRKFPAQIREVRFASEVVQGVVTYKAVLSIDNSELLLRPGMTATADIKVEEVQDAILVPNPALRYSPELADARDERTFLQRILPGRPRFSRSQPPAERNESRTVWILREGQPVPATVKVGVTDGRRTQLKSGDVKAGDLVITDQRARTS